jgi:hypothetical protein
MNLKWEDKLVSKVLPNYYHKTYMEKGINKLVY